ncbi:hypothetical protein PWY87_11385 [Kribbella solani]|uniref:COG4315 family predicted lipoprotein n=1 Tax=Kribbella solani TaxID=236067 RepID=UPI0029B2A7AA|nr:hypothetical protein [Kribbella solani]MDX2967985.1 hypothetical protein [Kribbella solani]MDX3002278.1 hypothetical protein [Kribbella solani]
MKRMGRLVGVTALGLAGLTACGGGNGYGSSGSSSSTPSAAPSSQAPSSQAAGGSKLGTASVGSLGTVVVDGNGRTVYVFDKDTKNKSNCEGGCLAQWPAVAAGTGTPRLTGISPSLVGSITRSDGTKQLTINGMPIYLFARDTQAGQANGQAFGGIWWVIGPDGKKITTKASSSGNGNGY